jgi:hypothetical protein
MHRTGAAVWHVDDGGRGGMARSEQLQAEAMSRQLSKEGVKRMITLRGVAASWSEHDESVAAAWAKLSELEWDAQVVQLAERRSSNLDVLLMWGKGSGRVWVDVRDRRSGRVTRIDTSPADALDAFKRPFSYIRDAA